MRIVYTRQDGGVSIVNSNSKEEIEKILGPLDDKEFKEHVWKTSVPKESINATEIADDYVLPDTEFRDAWSWDGNSISHDLKKASEIQLSRLRYQRDELLKKYDGLQMRAQDLNDISSLNDIKSKKNILRNATNALKSLNPSSIEDIKKSCPDLSSFND